MLPHRLKTARKKAGYTQEKLGVMAGIDEATARARISQYEKGTHAPDFGLVCRIAKVLQVPACYLYTVEDDLAEIILKYRQGS